MTERSSPTTGGCRWWDWSSGWPSRRNGRGVVYADIRYQVDEAVRGQAFGEPEG
jgi:hypothetical protein